MKHSSRLQYFAARYLRKAANRIAQKGVAPGSVFSGIGSEKLPKSAPRALVIYNLAGISRYVEERMHDSDPFFNRHTMYWESVELVRRLNHAGYVVDYADWRSPFTGDWKRYQVVFDQWDNLKNSGETPGQKKVHYATYWHWLPWNRGELERIQWFKDRTGIVVQSNRQMPPIASDEYADFLTYFGTQTQVDSFSQRPVKHQLDISAVFVPERRRKDISKARKNFLWLGGGGLVHKGLDIAMEAVARVPEATLYIAGNLMDEPKFHTWAKPFITKHRNIRPLGWVDVGSPEFDSIARNCIGILYPSAAEGGPGSVAQAIHWGLIPIVTRSALVRAETFGYILADGSFQTMVDSAANHLRTIMATPDSELEAKSDAVADYAREHHTRQAYSKSVDSLIRKISTI